MKSAVPFAASIIIAAFAAVSPFPAPVRAADKGDSKRLIERLESADASTQMQAQMELRTWRFKDVVEMVAKFGDGTNPDVRILMAQVLGELGGAESARYLQKLYFKEKVDGVRRAILIQLTGIIPTYEEAFGFYEQAALYDKNPDLRFLALSQLSLFARSEAFSPPLIEISRRIFKKDKDLKNRTFAALILTESGESSKKHSEQIDEAFSNPDPAVRIELVNVLGKFNGPDCAARLREIAQADPSLEVRDAAKKFVDNLPVPAP